LSQKPRRPRHRKPGNNNNNNLSERPSEEQGQGRNRPYKTGKTRERKFQNDKSGTPNNNNSNSEWRRNTPKFDKPRNEGSKGRTPSRQIFDAHITLEEAELGIKVKNIEKILFKNVMKEGTLYKGVIRVNAKNFHQAYVTAEGLLQDVYIDGSRARNRALDGDTVVVKLFPRDQWKILKSEEDDEEESMCWNEINYL
jgi:exoribonuclease R